jgi:hypothetical protein
MVIVTIVILVMITVTVTMNAVTATHGRVCVAKMIGIAMIFVTGIPHGTMVNVIMVTVIIILMTVITTIQVTIAAVTGKYMMMDTVQVVIVG